MKLKKNQFLILLLAGAVLLLLTLYFALVRPLTRPPETTTPPVTTGQGEGLQYQMGTLYPSIKRSDMKSITVHNKNGTYKFERLSAKEGEEPTNKDSFFMFQEKDGAFKSYAHIAYNQERFSELVVATGTFYYLRNLSNEEELAGGTLDYAEYGLAEEDDPAWFEIVTFSSPDPIRVYVGDAAVTDNGYYVRVEGRDTVYVSNSTLVGETALETLSSFVDPLLTSVFVQYGYYYTKDFTLWKPAAADHAITKQDSIRFTYRTVIDGVESESQLGSTDLRTARAEILTAFCGKTVAAGPFSFTMTYEDSKDVAEDFRGKTVEYRIERINSVSALYISLDFLNASKRSDFHAGVAYTITAPEEKTGYLPSSNNYMGILESVGALTGSETVAIGLDVETIEKYGLDAYVIYYDSPVTISYDKVNTDDIVVGAYVPNYLYISERQADGSYLVGSVLTDIVARVDGSVFRFLDFSDAWWLNSTMLTVNVTNVSKLKFDFNYTDADVTHSFGITSKLLDGKRKTVTAVSHLEDGKSINVSDFKKLYMHLVTIYYTEEYDGTLPIPEVMEKPPVLAMEITMSDGEVYTYRYYPYSARHVLVSIAKEGAEEGAYFYVLTPEVEKIYHDILLLLSGESPDPDKQY